MATRANIAGGWTVDPLYAEFERDASSDRPAPANVFDTLTEDDVLPFSANAPTGLEPWRIKPMSPATAAAPVMAGHS